MPLYFFLLTMFSGQPAFGSFRHGIRHGGRPPIVKASMIVLVIRSRISF